MRFAVILVALAVWCLPAMAQQPPWLSVDGIGFTNYGDPFFTVSKDNKRYMYHAQSGVLADATENRAAGMTVVMKDGQYGVMRDDGKLIVPFDYEEVRLENDYQGQWYPGIPYHYKFITVRKASRFGLMDEEGHVIAPPQYDEIKVLNKHIIGFKEGGLWGWLDAQIGLVAQPAVYDEIGRFLLDEYVSVMKGDKRGLAAKDGTVVIPVEHTGFLGYVQARDKVFVRGDRDGNVLYDLDGNVRFAGFSKLGTMRHADFITFEKDGLTGAVNPLTGDIVIEPIYDRIEDGVRGRFIVRKDGLHGVLDEQGKTIVPALYSQLDLINVDNQTKASTIPRIDGAAGMPLSQDEWQTKLRNYRDFMDSQVYFIRVDRGSGQGLFDWQGQMLASPNEYEAVRLVFHKSPYIIAGSTDSQYMAILDSAGRLMGEFPYEQDDSYQYDKASIAHDWEIGNRFVPFITPSPDESYSYQIGLYDLENAKIAMPMAQQRIEWLDGQYFKVRDAVNEKTTLYTRDGTPLVSFDAPVEDLFVVGPNHVLLRCGHVYRLADMAGNILYENPQWGTRSGFGARQFPKMEGKETGIFHHGLMKLYTREGNLFVNERGEEVRFDGYQDVDEFYAGTALVAVENAGGGYRFGLVGPNGNEIHPATWEWVLAFHGNPDWITVFKDGKQGLADRKGNYVLEPVYDQIGALDNGYNFEIKKDGKVGLAARDGRIIIEPRFERIHRNYEGKDRTWPLVAQEGDEFVVLDENGQYLPVRAQRYMY